MIITKRIFKPIKHYDMEIRKIEKHKTETEVYFVVEIGIYESLGEMGEVLTFLYDDKPTETELIKDTEHRLKEIWQELKENGLLSSREEAYLKILNNIFSRAGL